MAAPVLVYGGTFDPVHAGHVAVARAAADAVGAGRVLLVPCGDPPHRQAPSAPGAERAAMLRLAFADDPRFQVDERELRRVGRSYTVDTLTALRGELGEQQPIVLLLGVDAANGLPTWHRPQDLPALAHLLLFARPQVQLAAATLSLGWQPAAEASDLARLPAGLCWQFLAPVSDLSSTAIRHALRGGEAGMDGLHPAVLDHIRRRGLYR